MLSALILSGGYGTRIGGDKGLVELGGAPLVKYVAGVLSTVADELIVSVAARKLRAYSNVLGNDPIYVEDEREGIGPLEGLALGLTHAQGEYVLVSPCDTPFLRSSVCEATVDAAMGRDGAVPKTGDKLLEPLHGVYRRKPCADAFRRVISDGGRTPRQAYKGLDIVFLEEDFIRSLDPELVSFWNINSPEDLRKAEAQLERLR